MKFRQILVFLAVALFSLSASAQDATDNTPTNSCGKAHTKKSSHHNHATKTDANTSTDATTTQNSN
jgi:hypothetical protein